MPKHKGHGLPRGAVSKAQWRFLFANPRTKTIARKEAHKAEASGGGPKVAYHRLPPRKGFRRR